MLFLKFEEHRSICSHVPGRSIGFDPLPLGTGILSICLSSGSLSEMSTGWKILLCYSTTLNFFTLLTKIPVETEK